MAGTPRPAVTAPHYEPGTLPRTGSDPTPMDDMAPQSTRACWWSPQVVRVVTMSQRWHLGASRSARAGYVPNSGIPQSAGREGRRARLSDRIKAEILAKRPRGGGHAQTPSRVSASRTVNPGLTPRRPSGSDPRDDPLSYGYLPAWERRGPTDSGTNHASPRSAASGGRPTPAARRVETRNAAIH